MSPIHNIFLLNLESLKLFKEKLMTCLKAFPLLDLITPNLPETLKGLHLFIGAAWCSRKVKSK